MHLIIYGPEGSGKGTQAELLSEKLGLPIFSSGDLVREHALKDKGKLGEVCRNALKRGLYVPDEKMYELWQNILKNSRAKRGFILDGFPRTVAQAKFLIKEIKKYNYKIDKVIYLNLSDEEAVKRLAKRGRKLFAGSNVNHDDPKRVKERLKIYHRKEKELLELFKKFNLLSEVNADKSVEEVFAGVLRAIPHSSHQ